MDLRCLPSASRRVLVGSVIGLIAAILAWPIPAEAQHRAHLSRGLTREIQQRPNATVGIIVDGPQSEIDRLARTYGLTVVSRLDSGAKLQGTAAQVDATAGDPAVKSIVEDERVAGTMAVTTASTGASQLWASKDSGFGGITGRGVNVVVIDSGIASNGDLDNRVMTWVDFVDPSSTERVDTYGHGTHVGGIIAGSGKGSRGAEGGAYIGMAPGANLISLRVLGTDGSGYVSDVIKAIDWTIRNRDRFNIRVINLSLGHPATTAYSDDPLARAVERAVANGIVVVCSAGNLGKTDDGTPIVGAIVSPGDTPGALTVGALNTHGTVARSDDSMATYSSRGPVGDPDDPVDVGTQAGRGRAGQRDHLGRHAGQLSLGQLPDAARLRRQRRNVHDVVGIEHGVGGRRGCGGADSPGQSKALTRRSEIRPPVHRAAHQWVRFD